MYSNYSNFIERAEVRLFNFDQPLRSEPLATVPLGKNNRAIWAAEFTEVEGAVRRLVYVLRVYDDKGDYDETTALPLWVVNELDQNSEDSTREAIDEDEWLNRQLLAGYGENHLSTQHIKIKGGTVTAFGKNIPQNHNVWLAGKKVPVNEQGEFVIEEMFAEGMHTVEVAVLDDEGNGELYLRDLGFSEDDWFYVVIGDLTMAYDDTSGSAKLLTQDPDEFNDDTSLSGRFAYYVEGSFGDDWQLTSSADTQEGPADELFSNFLDKDPQALLRRLDPDLYYPTFGEKEILKKLNHTAFVKEY